MASKKEMTISAAIRSVARFWSILSIGLVLLFFLSEGLKIFELTAKEWFAFILFPVGLVTGLLISWKKEIAGSLISIFSVIIFSFLIGVNWFVYGLLSPALLFLVYGLLKRIS
jgi:hypothetical protein